MRQNPHQTSTPLVVTGRSDTSLQKQTWQALLALALIVTIAFGTRVCHKKLSVQIADKTRIQPSVINKTNNSKRKVKNETITHVKKIK